jgi:hypothetical protein
MRSTLPIGIYEDVVGDYLAAGDFVWLKEKKRFMCAGYDVLSRRGHIILLGNRLGHQSTYYQLNYFVSNQDVPEEARPIIEETMLAEFHFFYEIDIVAHCYSDEIESTARVVHASNYDSTIMRGLFKTFCAVSRVACGSGYRSSSIDSAQLFESSSDLIQSTSHYISTAIKVFGKCCQIGNITRHLLSRVGANQRLTCKASVAMTPDQLSTLKREMLSMPMQTNEHPMHLSVVTTDVRARHLVCSCDKIIMVNSTLVMSEKNDDAYTRERVKAYTKAHIQFLQSIMFGHIFGVGPNLVYPKLDRVPDPIGGRKRTEPHRSKPVMNGVLVNCITHLPTTAHYSEAPLEQFGKHNVDDISFVYENYPEILTIRVTYISCSLLKEKQKIECLALKCTMIHLGQLKPVKCSLLTE